jgi:DNA polymerase III delta prime subunit
MSLQNGVQNSLWTEKYRPKSLTDYYISKKQIDTVKEWITELKTNEPDAKPFLILHGTAGIGKTTLAHLILKKYGYEIIECNASDTRSKKQIRETIGGISKISVCIDNKDNFKPTAIIMDEIDGLNGSSETSGVQELIDIVITKDKHSKDIKWVCPVICTTNSIKDKKLQSLLRYGVLINFEKPSNNDCIKLINKIAKTENFFIQDIDKDKIINNANGDYRQIIMLLHEYYNKLQLYKNENTDTYTYYTIDNNVNNNISILEDDKNIVSGIIKYGTNIVEGDGYIYDVNVIKKINNLGDTPLDKINYFLTNNVDLDTIRYFCSGDSNLFFMNFYNNIISTVSTIQDKQNLKTKDALLQSYKILSKVYNSIKNADLLNNKIFLDKNWDLLDYFDIFSIGIPSSIIFNYNLKNKLPSNTNNKQELFIKNFNLSHHTQYNYMRQEQSMNKKKIAIDYMKTFENNIINIYYSLKRFQHNNADNIKKNGTKSRKKNIDPEEKKFIIDKSYLKILEKLDELLN